jgi:hypothetical protein
MNLMSIHRISLSLAGLLLIGATSAYAQTAAMICGTVTDPSGAGAPGVTVTLSGGNDYSTAIATTMTAAKGDYLFPSVPVGTYTLSFTLDGFMKTVRPGLNVTAGFDLRADQRIEPSMTVVEEVSVGYLPHVDVKKYTPMNGPQPIRGCTAPR